ncbi:MAG: ferritin [Candidatus Methanoplasma sp.]|jgi:ferritin|nr:ferritin [Candidatus Methanoplasma sp.]
MLNKNVAKLLNEQVNKELYSSYLYLDFSNYYRNKGLDGFANWYFIQAQEERDHALIVYNYLHENGEIVSLEAIAKPHVKIESSEDPLKAALGHEIFITDSINTIYEAAIKAKDFRTQQFLDWFVREQGEEEANASGLITKFELFGKDGRGLYLINEELKARTYTPPSPLTRTE